MISVIPLVFLCHRKYVNRKRRTLCYMQHSTLTQNFLHGSVNIALVRTAIRKLQSLSAPFNPVYNFSSLLSRITSRILPNYHYTKQRPPLFYNALKSFFIHSEVWGLCLWTNLRVSHCMLSVRLSIRLAYTCIFHPSILTVSHFQLPHFLVSVWSTKFLKF